MENVKHDYLTFVIPKNNMGDICNRRQRIKSTLYSKYLWLPNSKMSY